MVFQFNGNADTPGLGGGQTANYEAFLPRWYSRSLGTHCQATVARHAEGLHFCPFPKTKTVEMHIF